MTIQSVLGLLPQDGDVGIEIEMEGENIPPTSRIPAIWRKEKDASLRGESAEFVLRQPVSLTDAKRSLQALSEALQREGTVFRPTYRAGIHVHVNVQDLTPVQLFTFICAYFVLEETLLRFCDKSRLGNHFCLRLSDADYLLDKLVEAIQKEDLRILDTDDLRYASLNVTSLFKYGSIEFRALESTLDIEKIFVWASVLVQLREYAKTLSSPVDLLGQASVMGFEQYAPIMLGHCYQHFKPWATRENVERGIRNIQEAVFSRDWNQPNFNIFKKNSLF